jgi:NAD-dependent dihydropyrimidine dehydrogenase PreA subunit
MARPRTFMGIPRERIPWAPVVDVERCSGCGACLDECPNGVYALDDQEGVARVVAPNQCVVLCDKCAPACPSDAISFPDKDATKRLLRELASHARAPD